MNKMQPFIERQSSCNKSTKRCVQVVKLKSQIEICFILFWKNVCTQFHRTSLVLVMHVYCVANCGHNRITSCFTSSQYTTRYLNNLSFVGISHWNTHIFLCLFPHILALSLSFSLCLFFGATSHAHISMYTKFLTTFGKQIKYRYHTFMTGTSRCLSKQFQFSSYLSIWAEMVLKV